MHAGFHPAIWYRNYSLEIVMNFVRKYVYVDGEGNIVYLHNFFKFEKLG